MWSAITDQVINKLSIMDGSSAPVDPLPDYKQSNNCGDDPLNGYGSKNLAAGENPNNHMFHSGPGSQPAEAWTVGSGWVNPSSFGYPYPPPPGMYDPTGQYPPVESYPPPPAYPPTNHCCHSSLQQQSVRSRDQWKPTPHPSARDSTSSILLQTHDHRPAWYSGCVEWSLVCWLSSMQVS